MTHGRVLVATLAAFAVAPASAHAIGDFHAVLAQGEGQTVNAAYQASGQPPGRFVDQQPLYAGIMPKAASLTAGDIGTFYRSTDFGAMPGGPGATFSPRPGLQIVRDGAHGVAHITGQSRDDVMFGAGWASAQERLFLMDALRRTARGTLAGLTGPGAASGDAEQLTDQDFSDQELTKQFDSLPARLGPDGAQARQDITAYINGINSYIGSTETDPTCCRPSTRHWGRGRNRGRSATPRRSRSSSSRSSRSPTATST